MDTNQEKNTEAATPAAVANIERGKRALKTFIVVSGVVVVLVLAGMFLVRNHVSTDNAQVEADVIPVAPRVGGMIAEVLIQDNQVVKQGDVILRIDDADIQARLNQARADLKVAQAQLAAAEAQEKVLSSSAKGGYSSALAMVDNSLASSSSADAQVISAQAAVDKAGAQFRNAGLELDRIKSLFDSGGVSRSQLDNAQAAYDVAAAGLQQAQAGLTAAREQKRAAESMVASARGRAEQTRNVREQEETAHAQTQLAAAKVSSAEAALLLAENQEAYTTVRASCDGCVSKLSVHAGQLLVAGQTVAELVPATTYVMANFKEVQIGKIQPGDRVSIKLDAYSGKRFQGVVESISGGTGARFSLLPADNASGNFVKVVQRVPVRIVWTGESRGLRLQAGLSAKVTVYGGSGGHRS